MLFEEAYEEYKIYAAKRHKKQGFETLLRNFNLHILPFFKSKKICLLDKKDIINWQTIILSKNFSNSFNNSLYYCFSSFIKFCVNNNYLDENVVISVGKFNNKIEVKEHKIYNIWQFRWFRIHLKNYVIKQYFNFMYFYGPRPSEAMALKFSDLKGFRVRIIHSIHRRGDRALDTPKNQSSVRTFKISILCKIRFLLLKRCYVKKYGSCLNYFIFGGIKPLSTTTIDRIKKEACLKAKLYEITQHEFRHSFATRMIYKRIPINIVARLLGHSKPSTTLDIYLHEKRLLSNLFTRY